MALRFRMSLTPLWFVVMGDGSAGFEGRSVTMKSTYSGTPFVSGMKRNMIITVMREKVPKRK